MVVTQKQPPALISTSNSNQIVSGPQIIQGNQQIIAVSSNQPILMNTPIKQGVHRVVQQQQRPASQPVANNQTTQDDSKTSVIKSNVVNVQKPAQQPQMRQVITRQPVMVGNTKIGDREMVVNQPVTPEVRILSCIFFYIFITLLNKMIAIIKYLQVIWTEYLMWYTYLKVGIKRIDCFVLPLYNHLYFCVISNISLKIGWESFPP